MRDVRLWIAVALVAMMAGCADDSCSDQRPACGYSTGGYGVMRGACLDTGTVVRPAR